MHGLAKEHRYMTHRHRRQRGDGQREGEVGAGWRQEIGASVIVSTKKNKN